MIIIAISIILIMIYIGLYPSILLSLEHKKKTKEVKFNIYRHIINTLSFWIPAIITFCLMFFLIEDFRRCPLLGIPISFVSSLTVGTIGMLIGYKVNIKKAEELELAPDSKSVQEEKLKLKTGIAASALGSISVLRHTKNNIKDITNVDGWKEFK